MGPEDSEKKAVKVYMMVDGQPVEISPDIAEITYSEDEQSNDIFDFGECEITMRVKRAKRMRCGSRKRFVKLLMSRGINRNTAQLIARTVRATNIWTVPKEYKKSYQSFFVELFWREMLDWMGEKQNGQKA